jgi:hypothetical protein
MMSRYRNGFGTLRGTIASFSLAVAVSVLFIVLVILFCLKPFAVYPPSGGYGHGWVRRAALQWWRDVATC